MRRSILVAGRPLTDEENLMAMQVGAAVVEAEREAGDQPQDEGSSFAETLAALEARPKRRFQ